MRTHNSTEAPSVFWPGYVDALTNVVLNLLFLVAVLACGVFALGLQASLAPPQALPTGPDLAAPTPKAAPPSTPLLDLIIAPPPDQRPDDSAALDPAQQQFTLVEDTQMDRSHLLALRWREGERWLSDSERTRMASMLSPLIASSDTTLTLWSHATTEPANAHAPAHAHTPRDAYLRVMSVRDVLLSTQVPATHITPRLITRTSPSVDDLVVYLLIEKREP